MKTQKMDVRWTLDWSLDWTLDWTLWSIATLVCLAWVVPNTFAQVSQSDLVDKGVSETNVASRAKTVILTIDYGDGFQKRFNKIAWREGMTVLEVMQAAKKHERASFDFETRGRGATALLLKIDDVANQGGGKRNWIYHVNKRKGERSFGIQQLKAGDEVLWRFETYL